MVDDSHGDGRLERAARTEKQRLREEVRGRMFGKAPAPVEVDRFALRRKLGEGATGIVYAAFDPRMHREVALKLIVAGPRDEASLFAEARAVAQLRHPNLVPAFEVGVHDGIPYIVSELVEGGTLRDFMAETHPPEVLCEMVIAIGRGVAEAHRRGLVHRDLKPENVLVGDGRPRITDFGLAQVYDLVGAGEGERRRLPGTPLYMAPEHLRGERADPLSDQWSYCALAFEVLYGVHPFGGSPAYGGIAQRDVPKGHALASLGAVITRGLARDPSARFASMGALIEALEQVAVRTHRRRLSMVVGLLVAISVAVAAGFVARVSRDEPPGAQASASEAERDRVLYSRVQPLLQAGRYDDCADALEGETMSVMMRQVWVTCAEQSRDPAKLERACAAWREVSPTTVHTWCGETILAMRSLHLAGRHRECAELGLGAPPAQANLVALARCVGAVNETALNQRLCVYQRRLANAPDPEAGCGIAEMRDLTTSPP